VVAAAGPDPALAIPLHHAAKEMGLSEQLGVGTVGVGTTGMGTDELEKPNQSDRSATTNCDKIDSKESGVNSPFHFEQKQICMTNRKANRKANSA